MLIVFPIITRKKDSRIVSNNRITKDVIAQSRSTLRDTKSALPLQCFYSMLAEEYHLNFLSLFTTVLQAEVLQMPALNKHKQGWWQCYLNTPYDFNQLYLTHD